MVVNTLNSSEQKYEMQCLICEQEIKHIKDWEPCLDGAGELTAYFGYGSEHDMLPAYVACLSEDAPALDKLLICDAVKAYICDECFKLKYRLFHGFKVKETRKETKEV